MVGRWQRGCVRQYTSICNTDGGGGGGCGRDVSDNAILVSAVMGSLLVRRCHQGCVRYYHLVFREVIRCRRVSEQEAEAVGIHHRFPYPISRHTAI